MGGPEKGRDEPAPNRRLSGGPRHLDWHALRSQFVASDEALEPFAARVGIAYSTARVRAKREGWQALREAARTKVAAGTVARVVRQRIRSESEIDGQAHRAAGKFARHVGRMLDGVEKLTLDNAPKVKAAAEALALLHRLARVTAHLPAEPVATPEAGALDGALVIKRRSPDGIEVEIHVGASGHRPDGPPSDEDAVGVPHGRDE